MAVGFPGQQIKVTVSIKYIPLQICSINRTPEFTHSILLEKSLKVYRPIFTVKNKNSPGMQWPV